MPFAGYKDFDACIKDQIKKGYSKQQAGGICGLIEKRHKQKRTLKEKRYKMAHEEFGSFDECVEAMIKNGHGHEEAMNMCRQHYPEEDENNLVDSKFVDNIFNTLEEIEDDVFGLAKISYQKKSRVRLQ